MATAVGVAALIIALASAVIAFRSWQAARDSAAASAKSASAAERSATAAESSDRREREPRLSVWLDSPTPAPGDRVIYNLRNDGPQDLDSILVYRPEPPDRVIYALAVIGSGGWTESEISLGPLPVTRVQRFTLSCGTARVLPEFRVRIICRAGDDEWLLSHVLPPPRGAPLSEEEKLNRRSVLSEALVEIDEGLRTLENVPSWWDRALRDDKLKAASRLLAMHATDSMGPVEAAINTIASFREWRARAGSSFVATEAANHRQMLIAGLRSARKVMAEMRAALDDQGALARMWES